MVTALPKQKKARPFQARLPVSAQLLRRFCCFTFDRLGNSADFDPARLHRFGDFANQINNKHAVSQFRALHLDMVGELEASLERAAGNPAVEILGVIALTIALADNHELTVTAVSYQHLRAHETKANLV